MIFAYIFQNFIHGSVLCKYIVLCQWNSFKMMIHVDIDYELLGFIFTLCYKCRCLVTRMICVNIVMKLEQMSVLNDLHKIKTCVHANYFIYILKSCFWNMSEDIIVCRIQVQMYLYFFIVDLRTCDKYCKPTFIREDNIFRDLLNTNWFATTNFLQEAL